jgi:hypothetical protein
MIVLTTAKLPIVYSRTMLDFFLYIVLVLIVKTFGILKMELQNSFCWKNLKHFHKNCQLLSVSRVVEYVTQHPPLQRLLVVTD